MTRIDEVLHLVGRLNYVWTNTESLFIYLIGYLAGTSKEAAIVIFLTLNTTRARLDLLDRLAKLASTPPDARTQILALTGRLKQESRLRNKYNHCIYSFDEHGEFGSTQLMRIAEFDEDIKYGKIEVLDDEEIGRIQSAIAQVTAVNKSIWDFIRSHRIET